MAKGKFANPDRLVIKSTQRMLGLLDMTAGLLQRKERFPWDTVGLT